jgi:uncharacterized protein (DUF433 family)
MIKKSKSICKTGYYKVFMTENVKFLKLPKIPKSLLTGILQSAKEIPLDPGGRIFFEKMHPTAQIADHVAGRSGAGYELSSSYQQQISNLYSKYFNSEIFAIIGRQENIHGTGLSVTPPHCDRYRNVAINYILQLGGDRVLTVFYKKFRKNADVSTAENALYSDVELDFKVQFPENRWIVFDPQQYHSVENIEGVRMSMNLIFRDYKHNIGFQEFVKKYSHLIDYDTSLPVL